MIVYTCITNQKDNLQPVHKIAGVKYYCFSDRPFNHPVWQYLPIEPLGQTDGRRIARRYKILSHIYFPNRTTLWIDGRGQLNINPLDFLQKYKNCDMAIRRHHSRKCIYEEANEVKILNFEDHKIVDRQIKRYKSLGFPVNYGLRETGCILRYNTDKVKMFNSMWYAELASGSKRDQLSFDFIEWTLKDAPLIANMDREDVKFLRHQRRTNARY